MNQLKSASLLTILSVTILAVSGCGGDSANESSVPETSKPEASADKSGETPGLLSNPYNEADSATKKRKK